MVGGRWSISALALRKSSIFRQSIVTFAVRRTGNRSDRIQLTVVEGTGHSGDRGTGQRRGQRGTLRRDAASLRPELPRRRPKRRTTVVGRTAEASSDDVPQRRAETVAAETVQEEVGTERHIEEKVAYRL